MIWKQLDTHLDIHLSVDKGGPISQADFWNPSQKKNGDGSFSMAKSADSIQFHEQIFGSLAGESDATSSRLRAYLTLLEMIHFRKACFFFRAPHTDIKGCKCGWQFGIIFAFQKQCLVWVGNISVAAYPNGVLAWKFHQPSWKTSARNQLRYVLGCWVSQNPSGFFSHTFL